MMYMDELVVVADHPHGHDSLLMRKCLAGGVTMGEDGWPGASCPQKKPEEAS